MSNLIKNGIKEKKREINTYLINLKINPATHRNLNKIHSTLRILYQHDSKHSQILINVHDREGGPIERHVALCDDVREDGCGDFEC
jgi:hypothetical protein